VILTQARQQKHALIQTSSDERYPEFYRFHVNLRKGDAVESVSELFYQEIDFTHFAALKIASEYLRVV